MTILNRAMSAAVASGLLVIAGTGALALQAQAHNTSVGSGSVRSSGGGGMVAVTSGTRQTRSFVSLHQMHFHHAHHRNRDLFADGFFPFGFGWPISEPDLAATADDGDRSDWRRPPFWPHVDRYEPPTVEKSPSGVTIIRGPGSHHGVSPY